MNPPSPPARARAALAGLAHGGPGIPALARILGESLLEVPLDLAAMVRRWAALPDAGVELPPDLEPALRHLRAAGVPPAPGAPAAALGLAAHVAPVALLTHDVPANLLGGTVHIAAITHPGEEAAWAAVSLNVALARLLQGHRDFLPDVTEALRSNAAPAALLDRVRRIPVARQAALAPASTEAVRAVECVLWLAAREPVAPRGLAWLAGQGAPAGTRAAAGALFGARTGDPVFPEDPAMAALALRLARLERVR